jgi:phosphonate transport system ATP-binding protein
MIKIENLSHKYKNRDEEALKSINLHIKKGEIVALLGPSGSGKSTLIKCINKLVKPCSGKIFINGVNILDLKPRQLKEIRRKIAVIFQGFNLIERETVLKNALNGRLGYAKTLSSCFNHFEKEDYDIVEESLKSVSLWEIRNERVCNLSGGQKQRVAIARALAQNPEIILADEPVSNLDPTLMKDILSLLKRLCKEKGITLIITLHFIEMLKKDFQRIIGLVDGKLFFDDELQDYLKEETLKKRLEQLGYI